MGDPHSKLGLSAVFFRRDASCLCGTEFFSFSLENDEGKGAGGNGSGGLKMIPLPHVGLGVMRTVSPVMDALFMVVFLLSLGSSFW